MNHNVSLIPTETHDQILSRIFNINPNFDSKLDIVNNTTVASYIAEEGFRFGESFTIHRSRVQILIDRLKATAQQYFRVGEDKNIEAWISDTLRVFVMYGGSTDNSRVCLLSKSSIKEVYDFANANIDVFNPDKSDKIFIDYYYMNAREGLAINELEVNEADLGPIYPDLYPDIDIKKLIDAYQNSKDVVLILCGNPGTGKTTFIKYFLTHGQYKQIAYIKDPKAMETGDLWTRLTGNNPDLILFDDLDIGLLPRSKNQDSKFMTQLLSYSSGIFTNKNTKIIITTNQKIEEIDSALVRPGRCFDFLELNPLDRDQALEAWTNILSLNEAVFDETFGDATEITQASFMSEATRIGMQRQPREYIKNGNRHYTLDQKLADLNIKISHGTKKEEGVFKKR